MSKRSGDSSAAAIVGRLQQQVQDFLNTAHVQGQTLLLALSGGLDSMVLLDVLSQLQNSALDPAPDLDQTQTQTQTQNQTLAEQSPLASRLPAFALHAMHIHHGLSANADAWAEFCGERCEALAVPFLVERVKVQSGSGLGTEAAARHARYQALLGQPAASIVLAHHQDDQAETLLLQLLRGAGVKGLAAMASQDLNKRLLRPLLDVSRADILAYAQYRQLLWIEDESNDDTHYDRNFIRHEILPRLEQRYPAAKQTIARSASHMAEAMRLLDDLAVLDAERMLDAELDPQAPAMQPVLAMQQLNVQALAVLSEARAKNLLRWWLSSHGRPLPSARRLQEMLKQLLSAKSDAMLNIRLDGAAGGCLRRYQGQAYIALEPNGATIALLWQGEAALTLPDDSRLLFEKTQGEGLAYQRLHIDKLRITQRQGGERFKPHAAKPTRTLKHLLQESAMPPWLRQRLPLIYCDDALAVVPGIGIASHMQAGPHEEGLVVSWLDS